MVKTFCVKLTMILLFCAGSLSAQSPRPNPTVSAEGADELSPAASETRQTVVLQKKWEIVAGSASRQWTLLTFEISKEAAEKIRLTKKEKADYKGFTDNKLKIFKMYSAPSCAEKRLVFNAGAEDCLRAADLIRTSFYSFFLEMYGEKISDFRLLGEHLIAGNDKYTHGILVDLGPVDIDKLDKSSPDVESLFNFPIAQTADEEVRQRKELEEGISYRNWRLASKQKLSPNHVYLMRLIPYTFKNDRQSYFNKDTVFVLRVGQLNDDKITVVLWKKLAARNAPKISWTATSGAPKENSL